MKSRDFGTFERSVPIIGLGTWNIEQDERRSVIAALRAGIDAGATHIDTAEMYGDGAAEEIVREAIQGRRDEVFLVSKVLPSNSSRTGVVAACERSLRRLGTDRLDCYLLHWRGSEPLSETLAGFAALIAAGKILSWGVSNFDVDDLEDLRKASGGEMPACNQVLYHLKQRAIEHEVLPWCQRNGVALVAYSPFGQSNFPSKSSAGGRVLEHVAGRQGVTARQAALAFLTRGGGTFAIPKSADPSRVAENTTAGDVTLSPEDVAAIDAAFPRGQPPRGLPML